VIDWLIDHAPSARHMLAGNLAHLGLWILMLPPSVILWRDSVPYLVAISVWALIVGAIASTCATLAQLAAEDT
jgi:hypothetical protein